MKTATKVQKQAHFLGRAEFKASGYILYRVQCDGSEIHDVTFANGKVTACVVKATGEACKGFQYRHTCCHSQYVQAREDARQISILANKQAEAERKQQEQAQAMFLELATNSAPSHKMSDAEANDYFMSLGRAEDARKAERLSREAYNDEFSPCTVPGMY